MRVIMGSKKNAQEYFDRLKLAEVITKGDVDKAKKLLSGDYQNIYVIKGRFADQEKLYGVFLLFICEIENRLVRNITMAGSAPSLYENSPTNEWPAFLKQIERNRGQSFVDDELTGKLSQAFAKVLNEKSIPNVANAVNQNSISKITKSFKKILEKVIGSAGITCIIDYEKTTSLVLSDFFRSEEKDTTGKNPAVTETVEQEEEVDIDAIEEEIEETIIMAKPVLSPVKGKDIDTIEIGDEIWAVIRDTSQAAVQTAADLKLVNQGKMMPTTVSVMKKVRSGHNIFLYCSHLSAMDVMFKIVEHNGIKIQAMGNLEEVQEELHQKYESNGKSKGFLFVGGIVLGLVIVLLVVLLTL
jgi:hypothetical protein